MGFQLLEYSKNLNFKNIKYETYFWNSGDIQVHFKIRPYRI